MDASAYRAVSNLTPLTDYMRRWNLASEEIVRLCVACHDRAILLTEISDKVLTKKFVFSEYEMTKLKEISSKIAFELFHEMNTPGRHMRPISKTQDQFEAYYLFCSSLVPEDWSFVEYVSAAQSPSAFQLAQALKSVFREEQQHSEAVRRFSRGWSMDPTKLFHKFSDRVEASGISGFESVTQIVVEGKRTLGVRGDSRGKPQKRIKSMADNISFKSISGSEVPWSFRGHLASEAHFRTISKSFIGSWELSMSALMAWHIFMITYKPLCPHFPVQVVDLAPFSTYVDNAGTLKQYIGKLKQAHRLLRLEPLPGLDTSAVLRGANKNAPRYSTKRSFITRESLDKIVNVLDSWGESLLSDMLYVGYEWQLRAHSELFILCVDSRKKSLLYSAVEWDEQASEMTIVLSRRKNRPYESRITRTCWCVLSATQCGVCRLKRLLSKANDSPSHKPIFPQNKTGLSKLLKQAAEKIGLQGASWHGLRRGRTLDLLNLKDAKGRPLVTLAEVYESGQWVFGSESLISYIRESEFDGRRLALQTADQSDSE